VIVRFRLYVLLACFAPPVAVALVGCRRGDLLRSTALTALGWLPGAVHAAHLVCDWAQRQHPALLPNALAHT